MAVRGPAGWKWRLIKGLKILREPVGQLSADCRLFRGHHENMCTGPGSKTNALDTERNHGGHAVDMLLSHTACLLSLELRSNASPACL